MHFIPSRSHALLDYLYAAVLLSMPFWNIFQGNGAMQVFCPLLGSIILLYTLCTNYELGFWHIIPFEVHLWMDVMVSIILIILPVMFGLSLAQSLPVTGIGALGLTIVALTDKHVAHPDAKLPPRHLARSERRDYVL